MLLGVIASKFIIFIPTYIIQFLYTKHKLNLKTGINIHFYIINLIKFGITMFFASKDLHNTSLHLCVLWFYLCSFKPFICPKSIFKRTLHCMWWKICANFRKAAKKLRILPTTIWTMEETTKFWKLDTKWKFCEMDEWWRNYLTINPMHLVYSV